MRKLTTLFILSLFPFFVQRQSISLNEFKKSDYNLSEYNKSIKLSEFFKKNLSLMKEAFEIDRGQNCKLIPNR
jgi:hypothetical protein